MKKIISVLFILVLVNSINLFAQSWTELNSGTNQYFYGMRFPSENVGFVHGEGGLYKTSNAGNNWQQLTNIGLVATCYFTNEQTGYAVSGSVQKTTDGGANWTPGFTPTNIIITDMHFINDNVGFACGHLNAGLDVTYMKTTNGGGDWTEIALTNGYSENPAVFFTSALTGYVATFGQIFKTTDGGSNWEADTLGDMQFDIPDLWDIYFPTPDIGYACGNGMTSIYKTTDGGETWTGLNNPFNAYPFYSIFFTSTDTGFAAGGDGFSAGGIIKTVDGGTTWALSQSGSESLHAVCFPTSNTGYAAGANGTIYKYSSSTGIEDASNIIGIFLSPNPSTGIFKIELAEFKHGTMLEIIDITGRSILQSNLNSYQSTIDISSYSSGIYLVQVNYPDGKADRVEVVKE